MVTRQTTRGMQRDSSSASSSSSSSDISNDKFSPALLGGQPSIMNIPPTPPAQVKSRRISVPVSCLVFNNGDNLEDIPKSGMIDLSFPSKEEADDIIVNLEVQPWDTRLEKPEGTRKKRKIQLEDNVAIVLRPSSSGTNSGTNSHKVTLRSDLKDIVAAVEEILIGSFDPVVICDRNGVHKSIFARTMARKKRLLCATKPNQDPLGCIQDASMKFGKSWMLDDLGHDRFQWLVSPLDKINDQNSVNSDETPDLCRVVESGSLDLVVFCKNIDEEFEADEDGGQSGTAASTTTQAGGSERRQNSSVSFGREDVKKIWVSLQPPVVRHPDGSDVVETKRSEVSLFAVEVPNAMEFRKSTLRRSVIRQAIYKSIYAEKIGQSSELFHFVPSRCNTASRIETTDQLWRHIMKPSSKYNGDPTERLLHLALGRINTDAGDEPAHADDDDLSNQGPASQDYLHKSQSARRASPAKKQATSREGAGAASRSSYRDAQSFLRSLYKLDNTANPYYHGFGIEMEHQLIINWETKSYNGRRGWAVFGNCLQNDGTTEFPSASEIIPMVEWNGEKLSKLCGKVKLERGAFPPDADRPELPPRRPPGPTTPNTASSVSPFGGSLSAILEGDVSLGNAMIIASALNNNSMGGVDLNAHLGGPTSQQGPTHVTKPPAVPVLYFKRESDREMLEVPPLLVNGVTLSVESRLSDAAEIAHKMPSGPAVLLRDGRHLIC
eukprot:scaffold121519_cov29-Attheya_sp.AAC.1